MPISSLSQLCHKALLVSLLAEDPYITRAEYLDLLQALFLSTGNGAHFSCDEDLIVQQASEEFWRMSEAKLKKMSPCCCGKCGRRLVLAGYAPWRDACMTRKDPY